MSAVLLTNEFDVSNISYSDPKKNTMGGQNVLINYSPNGRGGPIVIQTPRMRVPFGYERQEPEGGGQSRYSVNLTLVNDGQIGKFFDVIKEIEDHVKNTAVDKSEEWFGKKKSLEVVSELMRSVVKYPKDPKYNPTLKVKLPTNDKGPQCTLEDEKKCKIDIFPNDEIDFSPIEKGCEMTCVLQCTGVYFIGKSQFGIGFKVLKARIYNGNPLRNIEIVDEEDENAYQDFE